MSSVSVTVWCAMIRACEKAHGPKLCGERIEDFRRLLGEAEEIYKGLPDAPAKKTRRTKGGE